ncbi:hypothetical protein HanPSC8_Chr11g0477311 [Helianthus annuus]|nr:hypothetical protein HanPSC8_Chr11g0477311 [Helianthus annuus]
MTMVTGLAAVDARFEDYRWWFRRQRLTVGTQRFFWSDNTKLNNLRLFILLSIHVQW